MTMIEAPVEGFLHYDLFMQSERAQWRMSDIPWDEIDRDAVDDLLIKYVHKASLTEMTTYEASRRFMDAFGDDADFTQWVSVWFYEETKHPQALQHWLRHFGVELTSDEMLAARLTYPFVDSALGTLVINVLAETIAAEGYLRLAEVCREPVLVTILTNLARDEARHASAFYAFAKKYLANDPNPVAAKRTVLLILFMWFKQRTRMKHPGMIQLGELSAYTGDGSQDWLEISGSDVLDRICRQFSLLLDEPTLQSERDIKRVLRALPR